MTEVDEIPSPLAEAHARAEHRCQLCDVKNFSIGSRDRDGNFHPLFQPHPDPAEARAQIGRLAWCGKNGPEVLLRVMRIVCSVVAIVENGEQATKLLCRRCEHHVKEAIEREAAA